MHTLRQPKTDVSGVKSGVSSVLDSADPFCLVGSGDFIMLLTLFKTSWKNWFFALLKDCHLMESMFQHQEKNIFAYNGSTTAVT